MEQDQQQEKPNPDELIARFERCANFPRTPEGVIFLSQGLAKASEITGVDAEEIVEACALISARCPTDADLLTVARGIRDERQREEQSKQNQKAQWERDYGKPEPYDYRAESQKIMADAKGRREKDRSMLKLIRQEAMRDPNSAYARGASLQRMPHLDWMRLKIWAQEQVGIAVTPEQRKEVGYEYYTPNR